MRENDFCKLVFADVERILLIEEQAHSHPWTRGNFHDSLYSGHELAGLQNSHQELLGYFVLMPVVDEMHLLNFAVAREHQGQGHALLLLDYLCRCASEQNFLSVLLEVRISNHRAIEIYQRYGFSEIGRRKSYYPAAENTREDAIVMRLELPTKMKL
jgi:ribosomal-protein-alanine N-acetyltransferase